MIKVRSSFVPGLFPFIAVSPTSSQSSDIHTVGWVGDTLCVAIDGVPQISEFMALLRDLFSSRKWD